MTNTNTIPYDFTDEIVPRILNKLHGYVTLTERTSEELTDLEYDNVVTIEEIEEFYLSAISQCVSYCNLETYPTDTIIVEEVEVTVMNPNFQLGVILYTSGLIWRKYDIRSVDQIEENSNYVVSYGDQLIIDAKKQIDPFKYQYFSVW